MDEQSENLPVTDSIFLVGALVYRAFLYYEQGEKNKKLLMEQQSTKADYQMLLKKNEKVEEELK